MRSKALMLLCCVSCAGSMAEVLAKDESEVIASNKHRVHEVEVSQNSSKTYLPYLQLGGMGVFNSNQTGSATGADLFLPLWQDAVAQHLVFNHLRLFDRSGKSFEGNAHLGYRFLDPDRQRIYGFYGAFDRKRSDLGNYYNQLTFGVEMTQGIYLCGNLMMRLLRCTIVTIFELYSIR